MIRRILAASAWGISVFLLSKILVHLFVYFAFLAGMMFFGKIGFRYKDIVLEWPPIILGFDALCLGLFGFLPGTRRRSGMVWKQEEDTFMKKIFS